MITIPLADLIENASVSKRPCGGDSMSNTNTNNTTNNNCNCGCDHEHTYPFGYWCPPPPMPPHCDCPPYPEYPYPCPPVNPGIASVEAQIGKLSKKAATIRKMINSLVNCNKSIIISVPRSTSYNFGTYTNTEGETTEYGKAILDILNKELEAIKAKIVELTAELEVEDQPVGEIESTVSL